MTDVLAPGYRARRVRPSDAEPLLALMVASDIDEFGEAEGVTLEEIENGWKQIDLERDAWVIDDPLGQLVGYGSVLDRRHVRFDASVYVLPGHFQKGIGTTLVRLVEGRTRELVALAPENARVVLHNWINGRNEEARSLLEREGYAPDRYFWRMETALDEEPPAPLWPDGISVRTAVPGDDLRTFYETTEEAMEDHWGHVGSTYEEWYARIPMGKFDPDLWFMAVDRDEPVGAALCTTTEGIGYVETLAVRRPWRRRGLGMALLQHAFQEFHRRGLPRAALGVDAASPTGATRLYERAGMHVSQQYAAYAKELRPGEEITFEDDEESTAE